MRTYSSIPILLSLVWASTACDTSPVGIADSGDAAPLVVAPSAAIIRAGGTLQLNLSARDADGQATHPTGATWTSSNPSVATVGSDGIVTGRTPGTSLISAQWNGVQSLSTVTVIAEQPGTLECPVNPAVPEFLKRKSCA
ncbi:MAG: Ig-like domain-containing protein [Gemmatimonadales bacterium]